MFARHLRVKRFAVGAPRTCLSTACMALACVGMGCFGAGCSDTAEALGLLTSEETHQVSPDRGPGQSPRDTLASPAEALPAPDSSAQAGRDTDDSPGIVQTLIDNIVPDFASSGDAEQGDVVFWTAPLPPTWEAPDLPPLPDSHVFAYQFGAPIYIKPSRTSGVIGIGRRGAPFPIVHKLGGKGCERGRWYDIGGGYVCSRDGFSIRPSEWVKRSPLPNLSSALPHRYAMVVTKGAPRYFRLPTRAELEALQDEDDAPKGLLDTRLDGDYFIAVHKLVQGPSLEEHVAAPSGPSSEGQADANNRDAPTGKAVNAAMGTHEISIGAARIELGASAVQAHSGRAFTEPYVRSVRGRYYRARDLVFQASTGLFGQKLEAGDLPMAFVFEQAQPMYRWDGETLEDIGLAEMYARFPIKRRRRIAGVAYLEGPDGALIREEGVRIAARSKRPQEVPPRGKWIDIDLRQQMLVAYEGNQPRFATLVSTGKKGFETPRGTFQLREKHISTTMTGSDPVDGAYEVEEVPWTMYYWQSYALHGAYWHNNFGRVRSHGCTNLSPHDARWIFEWSEPELPARWHGMRMQEGTWIRVAKRSAPRLAGAKGGGKVSDNET